MNANKPPLQLNRRRVAALAVTAPLAACSTAQIGWLPDNKRKALFERGFKRVALVSMPPHSIQAASPDLRYLVFDERTPVVREPKVGPVQLDVHRSALPWVGLIALYSTVKNLKDSLDASRQFSRAMSTLPYDPYTHFAQRLAADLRDTGLEVVEHEASRPGSAFNDRLKGLPEVDAVIEQQVGFAFVRANRKQPFYPTLDVEFSIRSGARVNQVLGRQLWSGSMTAGDPPLWPDFASLLGSPQVAQELLFQMIEGYSPHYALAMNDPKAWTSNAA
jgi:hypothetical protein